MKRVFTILLACALGLSLPACLPGEEDVTVKYNEINRRTATENTGLSLAQAANAYASYLKGQGTVRKVLLDTVPLSFIPGMASNPMPTPPAGVKVVPCDPDMFGAITYFNQVPRGVRDLTSTGQTMAVELARRYGSDSVGIMTPNGAQIPKKGTEMNCKVGGDIVAGSPIFVAGFLYDGKILPDAKKILGGKTEITRDMAIPCGGTLVGVVKRKQVCTLTADDEETDFEEDTKTKIKNDQGQVAENEVQRLEKKWDCDPVDATSAPPPTPAEIERYCRDPFALNSLTKTPDNPIMVDISNLKQELDTGGQAYYTVVCRQGANAQTCSAVPYTPGGGNGTGTGTPPTNPPTVPPAPTCVDETVPEQIVINPSSPFTEDANGYLVSATPGATPNGPIVGNSACGHGWTGDLTAGYEVRRCNITNPDGTVDRNQTIYRIGYVAMKCKTTLSYQAQCPAIQGSNTNAFMPVTRNLTMLKPVALDLAGGAQPGQMSRSSVSGTDSPAETMARAAANGFVIPNTSRSTLSSASDDVTWSLALKNALDPTSLQDNVTACDGSYCNDGSAGAVTIMIDNSSSQPLRNYTGGVQEYDKLTCTGSGTCNPLLGSNQPTTCDAQCVVDARDPTLNVGQIGSNFQELLSDYIIKVSQTLPTGANIVPLRVGNSLPVFNEPSSVCDLAASRVPRLIIFAHYDPNLDAVNNVTCPALPGKTYSSMYDMVNDAISEYVRNGGDLRVYSVRAYTGNYGGPVYSGIIDPDVLSDTGSVTQTLTQWIENPAPTPDPCGFIN